MPDTTAISIETTGSDAASRSLKVTVPVDRVRAVEDKAVALYAKRARLPGFRPGKAPTAVVRKKFDQAIKQHVLEEVVREGWEEVQSTQDLKPIAGPSVRNLKFEDGSPVEFELFVEVRPEITLARTGGFTLTRTVARVDDAAVAEQLERLRERKAAWIPVDGGKPSPGNMVRVEVAAFEGDTAGQPRTDDIVLGQGRVVPDLEERIMALEPGQTVDTDIRFPDDDPDTTRRGTTRKVRVSLKEVKRQDLPALDDAFAGEIGDFASLDALRTAVRQDIEAEAVRNADAQVRSALVHELVSANAVPAPHSMVHRWLHAYAHQFGIPSEPHSALEKFEAEFHDIAEAQVRRDLVLDAVIEQEKLAAQESDIDERVATLAEGRGARPGDVYAQLQKAGRLPELERAISEEKAFAWLLSQSTVVEAGA
jgi:trigger factor